MTLTNTTNTNIEAAHWLEVFFDWKHSGLTQAEFCKQWHMNYGQFSAWRSRLIAQGVIERAPPAQPGKPAANLAVSKLEFVSLEPLSVPDLKLASAPLIPSAQPNMIELSLPYGMVLRMPAPC